MKKIKILSIFLLSPFFLMAQKDEIKYKNIDTTITTKCKIIKVKKDITFIVEQDTIIIPKKDVIYIERYFPYNDTDKKRK
jgi:hypothetical protein